jgi:hypothetical protein
MADWAPTVAEELRRDVRFALTLKIGKQQRPPTDTERDLVATAIVEHIKLCNGRSSAGRGGVALGIWDGQKPNEPSVARQANAKPGVMARAAETCHCDKAAMHFKLDT